MKAAVVTQAGLEIRVVPAPVPARNQVLVRVRACGLNRADLGVAAGHMEPRMHTGSKELERMKTLEGIQNALAMPSMRFAAMTVT